MKTIYSIGSDFAGTGIGNTAYRAALGPYRHNVLTRLICLDYKESEISKDIIKHFRLLKYLIWYPLKAFQRYIFSGYNPYLFLDRLYDNLSLKHIDECDIFHGWRGHSKLAAMKAKRLGAKIITVNASSHPISQNKILIDEYKKLGIKLKPYTKRQLKEAIEELNFADYVEVPSDFVYNSFIENGYPKKKLIKIPFGIDYEKYSYNKSKKDKRFRAIFVGSVNIRKGIHYLLQAWDELKLKDAELIICGRVWEDAKEIVKKYENNDTIKFLGFKKPQKWYERSDVFVFPTIEEGSALVTYEAMACGLPLITTYNSGTIAKDKKEALLIPLGDNEKLKESILFMYNNRDKCKKMGLAARKTVEKYSWNNYGENVFNAYEKILSKK